MNARVLTRGLMVGVALLLATTSVAFGQTLRITSPTDNQRIDLGFQQDVATTQQNVTVNFSFAFPAGTTSGKILVVLDNATQAAPTATVTATGTVATHTLTNVAAGSHMLTAYLANTAGTPFTTGTPVANVRFYMSRVCNDDDQCTDTDPCTTGYCFGQAGVQPWHGRCRFGPVGTDADCCVTPEWCRHAGLTFGNNFQYKCVTSIDPPDTVKDCVQCETNADCRTYLTCHAGTTGTCDAVTRTCKYTLQPNCCTANSDCDDSNPCTADSCNTTTRVCSYTNIADCCLSGADALRPGAPTFGCTPAAADPCLYYTCIGGTPIRGGTCASGPKYAGCCDVAGDCTDATKLTTCTDPDDTGHGQCNLADGTENGPTGTCIYPEVNPLCCEHNYECADQYPQKIGTCSTDAAYPDFKICKYQTNPDYCTSPVTTIVVNEVMVNPGGFVDPILNPNGDELVDIYAEWIELFNPTSADIDINGWIFSDAGGEEFTLNNGSPFFVPAGGFKVIGRETNNTSTGNALVSWQWPEPDPTAPEGSPLRRGYNLDNDTDEIIVKNVGGVEQDRVAWTIGSGGWPAATATNGASLALINPYLNNALATSWAVSKLVFDTEKGNKGTPRYVNRDVFLTTALPGSTCNDNNPCTLDVCNLDKADICTHQRLHDCCTTATAAADCNDANACTTDTCNSTTNTCSHAQITNCCTNDTDCELYYRTGLATDLRDEYDECAVKVCIGNQCRVGRNLSRPNCCVGAGDADFGCFDRNVCTVDACVVDKGVDGAVRFNQCVYALDLNNDNINDCCRLPEDCNDRNPGTIDTCDMNAISDDGSPGLNKCWYKPDPNYCGPGGNATCNDNNRCTTDVCCTGVGTPNSQCTTNGRCVHVPIANCCASDQNCVDGLACTTDSCCTGVRAPLAECTAANVCAHHALAVGCCETHADCNGAGKPADKYCRTGYCIGKVCRYGPPIEGCCVAAADCSPDVCTNYTCTNHTCQAQPVTNCCLTGSDCVDSNPNDCNANVCQENRCTQISVPNCCQDTNTTGPDPSCDDSNPCTSDYCTVQSSGQYQCRYFTTGGSGCCVSVDMCPEDGVQCTSPACTTNVCKLTPVPSCTTASPYKMTFTEGNAVYANQYTNLASIAWETVDLGTNPASQFWKFSKVGLLGPDQFLTFKPTATVANFKSCAVLPRFRSMGMDYATVQLEYAADWVSGSAKMTLMARTEGGWNTATKIGADINITADLTARSTTFPIPAELLNSEITQVAICVEGASTTAIAEVMVDTVILAQGQAPALADIASVSITKGQSRTVTSAFTVTEFDNEETVNVAILNPPGSWIKVVNVRKTTGQTWVGDLQITTAACPAASPYNYSLRVKADDGSLWAEKTFVLVVNGCP